MTVNDHKARARQDKTFWRCGAEFADTIVFYMVRSLPITLLLAYAMAACSPTQDEKGKVRESEVSDKAAYFKDVFIRKFKLIDLPLTMRPLETGERPKTNPESADTLFFRNGVTYVICYGMLPDTSKYYGLIWQGIADFEPPYLTTYTKQGDIIDETELFVGQCGGLDCGWMCTETIKIDEQYKIVSVDTVTTFDCDSVRGNLKKSVFYKSGYVNDEGIITITPKIEIHGIKMIDE